MVTPPLQQINVILHYHIHTGIKLNFIVVTNNQTRKIPIGGL